MTNTIHDMGGMHGFGAIVQEENEPVFNEAWEGRFWGSRQALVRSGKLKLRPGENRGIIETMGALAYLTTSYYGRFLHSTIDRIVAHGLLTEEELDERTAQLQAEPNLPMPRRLDPATAAGVRESLVTAPFPKPAAGEPLFEAGQTVVARNLNWVGHNRLPRYVRGRRGVVERVNGWYVIEDDHAERLGRNPQPVYTVRFEGTELWGPDSEPNLGVYLELSEGYLEASDEPEAADEGQPGAAAAARHQPASGGRS